MRQRALGRTGLKVSEIAIGGIGPMGKYGPVAADGTSPRDAGRPTGSYRGNPHFEVAPEAMAAIAARVAQMESAQQEVTGEDSSAYVFLRPDDSTRTDGEQTLVGRVQMDARALRIETNSQARADALRERIEAACGSRIRHRAREHMDPLTLNKNAGQPSPAPTLAHPNRRSW